MTKEVWHISVVSQNFWFSTYFFDTSSCKSYFWKNNFGHERLYKLDNAADNQYNRKDTWSMIHLVVFDPFAKSSYETFWDVHCHQENGEEKQNSNLKRQCILIKRFLQLFICTALLSLIVYRHNPLICYNMYYNDCACLFFFWGVISNLILALSLFFKYVAYKKKFKIHVRHISLLNNSLLPKISFKSLWRSDG